MAAPTSASVAFVHPAALARALKAQSAVARFSVGVARARAYIISAHAAVIRVALWKPPHATVPPAIPDHRRTGLDRPHGQAGGRADNTDGAGRSRRIAARAQIAGGATFADAYRAGIAGPGDAAGRGGPPVDAPAVRSECD